MFDAMVVGAGAGGSAAAYALAGHYHFGLGKLLRQSGDRTKAAEHLATAVKIYREMNMGLLAGESGAGVEHPTLSNHS
jgi:hypothetical protein